VIEKKFFIECAPRGNCRSACTTYSSGRI